MGDYQAFLASKRILAPPTGIEVDDADFHPSLFNFQRDLTRWALRKGRAAIFADTGLGKTRMQLEWARFTGQRTLIVAPLSVARQTVREAKQLDLTVHYVRSNAEVMGEDRLWITNYEMLDLFDLSKFGAIVLDESSILKAIGGKTRQKLIRLCADIPYRLCCSATPAPNDYTELGNHAHFLGGCTTAEMLATYFINANKQQAFVIDDKVYEKKGSDKGGQEWRLKHHAEEPFFRWLSSWAIAMTKPSDLGYDDEGFDLPPLNIYTHFVDAGYKPHDQLFFTTLKGVADRAKVRRQTINARLDILKSIVDPNDQWIIWCGLDAESNAVSYLFDDAVEVTGSQPPEVKAEAIEGFQDGGYRIIVLKPRIGGFGLNLQNSHKMAFFGLSDSWEQYYQCIRRQWRFRQEHPVDVHIIMSEAEQAVYQNVMRKDALAKRLRGQLMMAVRDYEKEELGISHMMTEQYAPREYEGHNWKLLLGDSCERLKEIGTDSIDLSVYSPPFADLFTYSATDRDLGNSRDWSQFFEHYGFIISEILRVTKPGRMTCVHTSDIPAMAFRDGYIGIKDFPGEAIRAYERAGWIFVGRAFVQKNPQAQAIRTKSKALLFVQLRKDSSDSRPALVDQVLLFKKPGDNAVPVKPVENGELDNETWIEWANGIWLGISESDTLSYSEARAPNDEKHICPLQLGTIERCVKLYSNPGELVLSPFAGIGSEGYEAVRLGRRFIGIELKESYFNTATKNLEKAAHTQNGRLL